MTPKDLKDWLGPKFDKLEDEVVQIRIIQSSQASDLAHHIKRTNLLEERLEQIAEEIKPVQNHVQKVNGAFILIGVVGTILGIAVSIIKLVG